MHGAPENSYIGNSSARPSSPSIKLILKNRYQADWDYALSTVYFCSAVILFFSIFHLLFKLNNSGFAKYRESHSPTWLSKRSMAALRYLTYRSYHIRAFGWYSPPLGVILLGLVGVTFFFGMILVSLSNESKRRRC